VHLCSWLSPLMLLATHSRIYTTAERKIDARWRECMPHGPARDATLVCNGRRHPPRAAIHWRRQIVL